MWWIFFWGGFYWIFICIMFVYVLGVFCSDGIIVNKVVERNGGVGMECQNERMRTIELLNSSATWFSVLCFMTSYYILLFYLLFIFVCYFLYYVVFFFLFLLDNHVQWCMNKNFWLTTLVLWEVLRALLRTWQFYKTQGN